RPSETPLAPLPAWLIPTSRTSGKATPPEHWRSLVTSVTPPGQRNDTLARFAGHLLRRRVDPVVVLELLIAWNMVRCSPPLPESEVITTVNSIAGRELQRRGAA